MTNKGDRGRSAAMALGDGQLGRLRHVCGLFDGSDHAYETLLPFIADGLKRGERALHIVDPAARSAHLSRLADVGIDVDGSIGAGRLEILTWDDAYLHGGRFDPNAMFRLIDAELAKSRHDGYQVSRTIGFMEWVVPGKVDENDLLAYETRVDRALRSRWDAVICAYDVQRHRPGLLLRVLDAHPLGIVDGHLRESTKALLPPRSRILAAASDLFQRNGIGSTGVDTLIETAGVAKATFYRQFPSKSDLVVAWLRDSQTRWFDTIKRTVEQNAANAEQGIAAVFEAVVEWVEAGDFRGCPYLNAAAEIVDPADPAREVVVEYLAEIEAYLRERLTALGSANPEAQAQQLHALLAGGITLSAAQGSAAPMVAARDAAVALVQS